MVVVYMYSLCSSRKVPYLVRTRETLLVFVDRTSSTILGLHLCFVVVNMLIFCSYTLGLPINVQDLDQQEANAANIPDLA